MMGADVKTVHMGTSTSQQRIHFFVDLIKKFGRKVASGKPRLVGHYNGRDSAFVKKSNSLGHSRNEAEPGYMINIPHLFIDGAVAVKEYSGSQGILPNINSSRAGEEAIRIFM